MKNRIDELIKLGLKDQAAFEKETGKLATAITKDPDLKIEISKEFDDSLAQKGREIETLKIKMQLQGIAELINLAYIARHYFGKSKQWLSQRINENKINGKPVTLTSEQVQTLNNALSDISKKIGSVSVTH